MMNITIEQEYQKFHIGDKANSSKSNVRMCNDRWWHKLYIIYSTESNTKYCYRKLFVCAYVYVYIYIYIYIHTHLSVGWTVHMMTLYLLLIYTYDDYSINKWS